MSWIPQELQIGIDIGSSAIKMVVADRKDSTCFKVESVALKHQPGTPDLPARAMDIRGAIKEVLAGLPTHQVAYKVAVSVLTNNLFILKLPLVKDTEVKSMLLWDLGSLLPNNVDDYEFDYKILKRDAKNKSIMVLVGVIPKSDVKLILDSFGKLAVRISAIEIDTLAAIDLLKSDALLDRKPVGILLFGARHTTYSIISEDYDPMFLTLPFGSDSLDRSGPAANGTRDHLSSEPFQIEGDARENSIPGASADNYSSELLSEVVEFAKTIFKFNVRYRSRTGEAVSIIYATGGPVSGPLISEMLTNDSMFIRTPCQIWDPFVNRRVESTGQTAPFFAFSVALGMALRHSK